MKTSNEGLSTENGDVLEELKSFGLSIDEYQRLVQLLGRAPTRAEMALIGVMWSEHCCYKSSKSELKSYPQQAKGS
ncbi:hypothetical protein [Methylacidiphilum kamchatkense]|uniref:Phosphoribosylformylglycinamidine synthase linker domain-containing protein n=1 Tax=Methylacidiphilum kamchatkense Kam1 TaxID=1202785 RepID=A0A516TNE1_9BACT|nr:hypothetical protein [Methylacidiphilum kamchatkense]QDQ42745.1 hypothetical protein kam1_1526 [Methylacidiphilum kamchatkense Kam1]